MDRMAAGSGPAVAAKVVLACARGALRRGVPLAGTKGCKLWAS